MINRRFRARAGGGGRPVPLTKDDREALADFKRAIIRAEKVVRDYAGLEYASEADTPTPAA